MAIDLNPGADTSLVNMAYYSASANAPKDYSKFYKDEADAKAAAYEKTMEASTKMWKEIITAGAGIAMEMKANAETYDLMASKATGVGGSEAVTAEIYKIKDGLKNAKLQGIFGTKEQKIEIARLKAEKERLYNQIQFTEDSVKAAAKVINTDNWDVNLSLYDAEMTNAILASVQTNKTTKNGNFAEYGFDEKTGEGMWTLYKTDEETGEKIPATLDDSKTLSITVKQLNESVKNSQKDGGKMHKDLNDIIQTSASESGIKSQTGEVSEQEIQLRTTQLNTLINTKNDLNRAIHTKVGLSGTSLADDLLGQSVYSAEVYNTLLEAMKGENPTYLTGDIIEGIKPEDNDGSPEGDASENVIDAYDLQTVENYQALVANILAQKDPEVTKKYFIEYALREYQQVFDYGNQKTVQDQGIKAIMVKGKTNYSKLSKAEKAIFDRKTKRLNEIISK
jgi:hypothetical protein